MAYSMFKIDYEIQTRSARHKVVFSAKKKQGNKVKKNEVCFADIFRLEMCKVNCSP